MKLILAIISLALAAKATAGIHSLPEDAPDGFYGHYIDSNGEPAYETVDVSTSAPASSRRSTPDTLIESAKFRRDGDIKCNNFLIGGLDLAEAEAQLAKYFDAGTKFYKVYSAKVGSAVAFACDYGKGQTYTSQQIGADMSAINLVCGPLGAGWKSYSESKSSYGRTQSSQSFCR
jgi:hypothetical protein